MDTNACWYISGQWVHPDTATISVNDVGVLRGYSVFESLRTYDCRPFHLDQHMMRLFRSARLIDMDIPWSAQYIAGIVLEVIARNTYQHAAIRLLVTGGESEDGILPSGIPTLAVLITPLRERDMEQFARGCKLITTKLQRNAPEAKTANYIAAVRALKEAVRRGATDTLFVNERG